ncbi:MAG TPA: TAXI family TRAP transporter solute-binding subunit [Hyphomicrobiaceae bacterium]|nr:TAXI family TRAP transporter solute-binding subunit [Hyphomicrobiaceae bacterium]
MLATFSWMRLTAAALVAGLTLVWTCANSMAQDEKKITVLSSPAGSGPYQAWAVVQTRAPDNHPWLRPIAVETPGFTYNVTYLAKNPDLWKTTVIGSGSVLEWAAKSGIAPFYKEKLLPVEDFRFIGVMAVSGILFVTTNPNIKTLDDFPGKRIATGLLTQNEWGMYPRMMLDGLGLTSKLKAINPLGTDPNVEALLDNRSDVATVVAFSSEDQRTTITPSPFKLLEASKRDWHYISVPAKVIEDYNAKTGAQFLVRRYPPNTLPNQPEEVTTYGNYLVMSAHKSMPDDLAYEFTKLWLKMSPVVAKYNAMGRIWTDQSISAAARLAPDAIHPGALRAYKELGLVN